MRTRFWIHPVLLVAASAIAAALSVLPAGAQQFSPWSAPVNLNNVVLKDGSVACSAYALVNSSSPDVNDTHPAISKNGLSLFFASTRPLQPGGPIVAYDIWVTQRASLDACWGTPRNLGSNVNSTAREVAPNLSPDGHWLFFHSDRPDGCGGGKVVELWAAHRDNVDDDLTWDPQLFNLGCASQTGGVNDFQILTLGSPNIDTDSAGPNFFDDGSGTLYLYFTRNTFPNDQQGFHIYVSTCSEDLYSCNTQGLWNQGIRVDALDSPFRDTRTAIRRDGLEMILSSARPDNLLSENLWVSTRPAVTLEQGNWRPPQPVNCDNMPCSSPWNPQGPLVNSPNFDGGPALSWDGTELYFMRVRPDQYTNGKCAEGITSGVPVDSNPGCRDLYVSARVFAVAGRDQIVDCTGASGATVMLDGSGSIGPHGDTLTFAWSDETGQNLGEGARISPTLPLGSHTITLTVTDAKLEEQSGVPSGTLSAHAVTHVTVRDNTPPSLSLSKTSITVVISTASASTMAINLDGIASATDTCDPSPTVTNDAPAQFPIGLTTVRFTAIDHGGNSLEKQLTVDVVYTFTTYLMPLLNDGSALYQSGRTVPVKFHLTAADGTFVSNAVATIQMFQVLNTPTGTVDMSLNTVASGSSNMGNLFRFDPTSNQYIYNLSTSGFASGTYLLRTTLNDGTTHEVNFSIK